jgi:hypothetical protein
MRYQVLACMSTINRYTILHVISNKWILQIRDNHILTEHISDMIISVETNIVYICFV